MRITKFLVAILTVVIIQVSQISPVFSQEITFTIDANKKAQEIESFGASAAWFAENIGKYWPEEKREEIARLLFSKNKNDNGDFEGIGLSSFRFNIGAGTYEQGESSGISKFTHRVESFLNEDGSYDWEKQQGYQFFLEKAKEYGVESLTAFANSPPVFYTKNGLGFKTEADYKVNLKPEYYEEYAEFLVTVVTHFNDKGIHFEYLSPVNEPQWDWIGKFGEAKQEGTPWTNEEIFRIIQKVDSVLSSHNSETKIMLPEAAMLTFLTGGNNHASNQIQTFFDPESEFFVGDLPNVPDLIVGHSYFTDSSDSVLYSVRERVAEEVEKYDISFLESEYSMLADGFREGTDRPRTAMETALFLSKVINQDLTVANSVGWEFWNSFEPGSSEFDTRYYLIALDPNETHTDGEFTATKNLWALGHYSQFVKPGMERVETERDDHLSKIEASQDVMISSFMNDEELVIVLINYTDEERSVILDLENFNDEVVSIEKYVTTAEKEMNMKPKEQSGLTALLDSASITTLVVHF